MSASSIGQAENDGVSEAAVRRALARAAGGEPLAQSEATILLHARGGDLGALLGLAAHPVVGVAPGRGGGRPRRDDHQGR